ncbi:hypothetical protein AX16_003696 [Volvariella volvacea WC 439]|nr:hypothetical protein AX16_003696 [Volvariella volvacea WC 439]
MPNASAGSRHVPIFVFVAAGVGLSMFGLNHLSKLFKHLRSSITDNETEIRRLNRELGESRDENRTLKFDLNKLRSEAQTKEESLNAIRLECKRLEVQAEGLGEDNTRLQKNLRTHMNDIEALRGELKTLRSKYDQTNALLDVRTQELKAAEVFLGKADKVSGADVIGLVQTLNSDIFQTAARLAESFEFRPKNASVNVDGVSLKEVEDAREHITQILGGELVAALSSVEHHEDPVVCQIAFQATMCNYCEWLIAAWSPQNGGQRSDSGRELTFLYNKLRASEDQSVSGRWRALTRRYARDLSSGEAILGTHLRDAFVDILLVAGSTASSSQIQDTIATKFLADIDAVVQAVQHVNRALGEEITSCDLQVVCIASGKEYNTSTMTADIAAQDGQVVVGTMDLGLLRQEKQGSELKDSLLLKPKVLLLAEINDL